MRESERESVSFVFEVCENILFASFDVRMMPLSFSSLLRLFLFYLAKN